jgi:hypothetical protein
MGMLIYKIEQGRSESVDLDHLWTRSKGEDEGSRQETVLLEGLSLRHEI